MDPVTLTILITLLVLFGGGATVSTTRTRRKARARDMRDAIRRRFKVADDLEVSLFDVFWDLGVSDFALEILGNQRLLLGDLQDLPVLEDTLADSVEVHGGYSRFIEETLETIQEFYSAHKGAGNRRQVPALAFKPRKTLPLPAVGADDAAAAQGSANLPVPYTGQHGAIVRAGFDRIDSRTVSAPLMPLSSDTTTFEVDIDTLTRVNPLEMLKSLFAGDPQRELERWWEMRTLRGLRMELDRQLSAFYAFYAEQALSNPGFYSHLYDTANRWDLEARRVDDLVERRPWKGRPWQLCADMLVAEARAVSKQLSWLSRNNVDQTIERIHEHARRGDTAMAGYLVYLNHHAFFAGRAPAYSEHMRRIDTCTYRMQEELRELNTRGVV